MSWREQLKSETCFLKKVEENFQQKHLNYITRRRQQRASETEEERKEKRKEPREKSTTTSAKEKVAGRRRRGPRFGCSEANQELQNAMKNEQLD